MRVFLTILLLFIASTAHASAKYYIDPVGGSDSNIGTTTSAPWKTCTNIDLLITDSAVTTQSKIKTDRIRGSNAGIDVYIKRGTTLTCPLNLVWTGTSSDIAELDAYGDPADPKPILDGGATAATGWTLHSGSIYKTTLSVADQAYYYGGSYGAAAIHTTVVTEDGVRMRKVPYDTPDVMNGDAARISLWGTAGMAPGTYTYNHTTRILYVWTSDSTTPADNLIEYTKGTTATAPFMRGSGVTTIYLPRTESESTSSTKIDYKRVANMHFKRWGQIALRGAGPTWPNMVNDNSTFEDNEFEMCGNECMRVGGDNIIVRRNNISDCNTEEEYDRGCLVLDGGEDASTDPSTTSSVNWQSYDNVVERNRSGSCFEVGFQMNHGVMHNNIGEACSNQFVELWQSSDNSIYNNYGATFSDTVTMVNCPRSGTNAYTSAVDPYSGDDCAVDQGVGVKIAKGSHRNLVYNNRLIGFRRAGVGTYGAGVANTNNRVYNNTIVMGTGINTPYGIGDDTNYRTDTGNIYNNNIIVSTYAGVKSYNTNNTFNYNNYYVTGGTFGIWGSSSYGTFGQWHNASNQESNAAIGDPDLDADYAVYLGSPAIDVGADLSAYFTTDYTGRTRPVGVAWDIGAYEHPSTGENPTPDPTPTPTPAPAAAPANYTIKGVTLKGIR